MNELPSYNLIQQRRILRLAREALLAALRGLDHEPVVGEDERFLHEQRGCFVTLHHRTGELRGCIGTFHADRPLHRILVDMAAAATRDPRFRDEPVALSEAGELNVEVSVLTPMQRIENPLKMRMGVDGIYIRGRSWGRAVTGCLLPHVATEQNWSAAEMLTYCCQHKMGLHAGAWRPPTALEFYVFQSIIIDEREHHEQF